RLFPITISRLESAGINVTVMGPVPDYSVDVPYTIAVGKSAKLERRYDDVASGNEYPVLSGARGFVDVAAWFCKKRCVVQVRGKGVLYRDSNHLSVNGALLFKEDLKRMLANPGAGVNG
ncbi:MAG: hypothetical protein KGL71_12085, partial [Xanthomonadaceae bacterium]|nr:hypothetical protein [Xanthomonadaceae bacterium]